MAKLHRAQPWAKRTAPSSSWKPTPEDIFVHIEVIHRAIRRAGIRPCDVEDVAADVIGRVWKSLRGFTGQPHDPVGSFQAWLNRIAWRTAYERRMREKYEQAITFANYDQDGLLYPSPHAQVVARIDLRRVGCLSRVYRETAVQLALTGSITLTAEVLRIPLGTAASRARKIRRALRKWGLR